jgi:glutamyl-tRNA synthetase
VGGVRTALFNWLYARHTGGTFLLRIEDTDRERSREEWVRQIPETLRWLGLGWDERVYRQSEHAEAYRSAVERLLGSGDAYDDDEGSVWFRTPTEGTSRFQDVIRGEVAVEWSTVDDFRIRRSNGDPIFYLANAVDDIDMGITHVVRGEDLLDSTHRVLAIRAALGHDDRPLYAHLPLILGPDRGKLSKRHGAVAVEDFRARGYLPEALVNYLSLLGFPAEEGHEIRPLDEIVAGFDLDRVNHSPAMFDHQKLDWMNEEHVRALPVDDLRARTRPFAESRFGAGFDASLFDAAVPLSQKVRTVTLADAVEHTAFLFADDETFRLDDDAWGAVEATERVREVLDAALAHLSDCPWTEDGVRLQPVIKALDLKPGKVMAALYAAVEGRPSGLPLFDSMLLLGRDRTLARLRAARDRLGP